MENNEIINSLPKHLLGLVIDQPYNDYTAQDHAIWRYVMRQNVRYLSQVAHHSYVEGLKKTGISIDTIPHMYGMNRILKDIGWAAVAVDGFIPPAAFMEFQAYNVLVIAADIRPINQVEYTPAPDIIHEAAGHAPIIADPEYSKYLVRFGELGCKAFSSATDHKMYEAIRHLSIVKADPYSSPSDIDQALSLLRQLEANPGNPSEMALIRNLHWWTVEYGLIGDLKEPRIYGAGLLSSIGESYSALNNGVEKLPYTLEAMHTSFDITTKQPQLFVTPDFNHLNNVLEGFAKTMALYKGGLEGIRKAILSENTATLVFSSGLQVSGTFGKVLTHNDEAVYLAAHGPAALSCANRQLDGHGRTYHAEGYSTPIGMLSGSTTPLEHMSTGDLEMLGIITGSICHLRFTSGVEVKGILEEVLRHDGKNLIMRFSGCSVTYRDEQLFRPEWGMYDMAVGASVISAFPGPADPEAFGLTFPAPEEKTHKIQHSPSALSLHTLYQQVRMVREGKLEGDTLLTLWEQCRQIPDEWLLPLEILEILTASGDESEMVQEIRHHLEAVKELFPDLNRIIDNGLTMC